MKKIFLILCSIITLSSAVFGYSKNRLKTVEGYIHFYGNDPFTYIGIVTEDGKEYGIKADNELMKELRESSGTKIKLEGLILKKDVENFIPNQLKDGILEVENIVK